ncbi:NUDIX hydrolase [Gloeocapsa sp. PCC 73106]|uniref:NUDIX hydrolase n=1 Tax=Gloeocapsa sp. PCC 73106 TaxID=102232 RepID=UPI0002AC722A|nr:NUDIX hydrolase [Gloeocapsa sp. PCC 73106]ELR96632.1 ADP-ribose pyrophosphatase [Gloeocapsa sp. PCC 73106]
MLRLAKTVLGIILRHPLTGTTIVPVLPDGRIVLVRRRDTGRWSLPGGLVDWGEDITTTVTRELKEETGLDLLNIRRLVGVYSSLARDPRMHSISVLVAAEVQGEFKIQDQAEITDVSGFSPETIPFGELSHDHDQQLQDYFQGLTTIA